MSPGELPICGGTTSSGATLTPTFRLSGGLRPTISWSPACRLTYVSVLAEVGDAAGGQRWTTFHSQALLVSPIRWGVLQPGAGQDSAARDLLPRSTYRIYAGYTPPQPAPYTWSMRSLPFTACGLAASGCVTTPEVFSGATRDGVTFTASTSKSVVARGDTAMIEFTIRNTTSSSRTVGSSLPCSGFGVSFQRADWTRHDFWPSECEGVTAPIVLAAGETVTIRHAFTGHAPNAAYCFRPDTYLIALYGGTFNGGLRDGSNAVSVTLRENSMARAACVGML